MFATLISFLGGSMMRMIWGELAAWFSSHQDHKHEIERMRLQGELDAAQHARNQDAIRLQAELGVKTIEVQGEIDLAKLDAEAFALGVENAGKLTGFAFVDIWKSSIQPALATGCMALIGLHYYHKGWLLDDRGWELAGAALGVFVADRLLFRRGK